MNEKLRQAQIETRMIKKINREFSKKKLLGDISINEEEYEILKKYTASHINTLVYAKNASVNNRIFAVGLVQIGMRGYDHAFWPRLESELNMTISPNQQGKITDAFLATVRIYKKQKLESSRKIEQILIHGFVSDQYAFDFFDFLFDYYRIDLLRYLENNTSKMMNSLIDSIIRNDNSNRTYKIIEHLALAVKYNPIGAKVRIRRFLKEIDNAFFSEEKTTIGGSRLLQKLEKWTEASNDFLLERKEYKGQGHLRKKAFVSPRERLNFRSQRLELVLPNVSFHQDNVEDVYWSIRTDQSRNEERVSVEWGPKGAIGYRCETKTWPIPYRIQNCDFEVRLMNGEKRTIHKHQIQHKKYRFFNEDGDLVNPIAFSGGTIFVLCKKEDILINNPREVIPIGELVCMPYKVNDGDIIWINDKFAVPIGSKTSERLLHAKPLEGAYVVENQDMIEIYDSTPSALMYFENKSFEGSVIQVNRVRHRLDPIHMVELPRNSILEKSAYLLNFQHYGIDGSGIYEVFLDTPNMQIKKWKFAIIQDFEFHFDSPLYIFETIGTLTFETSHIISLRTPQYNGLQYHKKDQILEFNLYPNINNIGIDVEINSKTYAINFNIPVFLWRQNNTDWNILRPDPIWFNTFPKSLDFKGPVKEVSMSISSDSELYLDNKAFHYNASLGYIPCDLTHIKSYIKHDRHLVKTHLWVKDRKYPFMEIFTRSRVINHRIMPNEEMTELSGEFEILGEGKYFIRISQGGQIIEPRIDLIEGKFTRKGSIRNGLYTIEIFEEEEDISGFNEEDGYRFDSFAIKIVNPKHLYGQKAKVTRIRNIVHGQISNSINDIGNLIVQFKDILPPSHQPGYIVEGMVGGIAYFMKMTFANKECITRGCLEWYDEEDECHSFFLYDRQEKKIVTMEEDGLPKEIKYKRYTALTIATHVFEIEFFDE